MCCFSGSVEDVENTSIFAGAQPDGRQWLAYEMTAAFNGEVAMVLPLPVPPGSPDDAVRFVSFEHLPTFFSRLETVFPAYLELISRQADGDDAPASAPLAVHDVGAFVASFVPRRTAFARLDPRFRLPDAFFTALPQLDDYGFAVFQLKNPLPAPPPPTFWQRLLGRRPPRPPAQHFHPMVFDFPRRDPARLFFPTVHFHHGTVEPTAEFDHVLYAQRPGLTETDDWSVARPEDGGGAFVELIGASRGVLNSADPLARRVMIGPHRNADVYL